VYELAETQSKLLTTEQAAAYLGGVVSVNTLINWRCTKRYDLPFVKLGRRVAYRKTDLDEFLASRTVRAIPVE
jgi:excisionase family DNA binding protein